MTKGPNPKPNSKRTELRGGFRQPAGTSDAPPLPGSEDYSERTKGWYQTWCESHQASTFVSTDWQRLHMLAPLVEIYWQTPSKDLLAEIRQNESKLGATTEDRQRLRMKIDPPTPDESDEKPTPSRQRRDPRKE